MPTNHNFKSLKEFYPYYLTEHSNPKNRLVHFIGTSLLFVIIALAIIMGKYSLLWFLPVAGYGFAWFGHFFIEKNKPATFKYPFYSLASDFIMYWHILSFQIKGQLKEAFKKYPVKS